LFYEDPQRPAKRSNKIISNPIKNGRLYLARSPCHHLLQCADFMSFQREKTEQVAINGILEVNFV